MVSNQELLCFDNFSNRITEFCRSMIEFEQNMHRSSDGFAKVCYGLHDIATIRPSGG